MADYQIQIGTKLDTSGINTALNGYKGKAIEVKSKLDTSSLKSALATYKSKPINVDVKLNTKGIAGKIKAIKPKTPIELNAKLNTKNLNSVIRGYKAKDIQLNAQLSFKGIASKISEFSKSAQPIKLKAELNKSAISSAVNEFNKAINAAESRTKIKIKAEPDLKGINKLISGYKVTSPLKVNVKINKTDINNQIKQFGDSKRYITVKAKLDNGAISQAIREYKTSTPIRVDLELDHTKIDGIISNYASKGGISIPAKLMPSPQGFTSGLTKKPIQIEATLNPEGINGAIGKFKPRNKIPVDLKLVPKDINAQIKSLPKIAEPINVGVQLDTKKINMDIALYQPTATLGIKPDLIIEDVEGQISAYVPKSPLKVNMQINNADIVNATKEQGAQKAIQVDVRLNPSEINQQIKAFKTTSKIKTGIKIDPKGVAEQIKKIQPKTKIKVGVQIDPADVAQQVGKVKVNTPIKLGVELNDDNILSQVKNIKGNLKELSNTKVDIGVNLQDKMAKGYGDVGKTYSSSYASKIAQDFKEVDIVIRSTGKQLSNLQRALSTAGFNNSAIQSMTNDFKELGVTVTNVKTSLNKDGSVKLTVKGLDQFKDAVTYINNIGSDGKLGNWSQSISRDINDIAVKFQRLKSLAQEIGNLKIDMFKSDDADEIQRMTADLNRLQKEYSELLASTQGGLKPQQLTQLDNTTKKSTEALNQLKREYAETRAELAKEIKGNFSNYQAQIISVESEMQKLANVTPQVKNAIENVKQALKDMHHATNNDNLIAAEERYQNALKETLAHLEMNQSAEKMGYYDDTFASKKEAALVRLNGLFENGSQAANKFGIEAQKLRKELDGVGSVPGIDNVNRKIGNLEKRVKNSHLQVKTLGTSLKEQFAKYSNYLSIYYVFMYVTQAFRSMFEQVKSIDSAMTELKKVTDETADSYNKFLSNAANRAKEIGTTIDGLVSSTADFARLGYGFEDAQGLAEVANIYAVVGDEVEGVEGATESLISTMAAFKKETSEMSNTDFAMSIIDKFNEVGNNFAISSGGIGEAMERSASAMMAANNTMDETIALITAANTVTQNPEVVGTAFKTMSMRIRGAKTE